MTNQPPQSIDAEMAVLGAILKKPAALDDLIDVRLTPEAFYHPRHKIIYQAILDLTDKGKPTDTTLVAENLTTRGQLDKIGGRSYLIDLIDGVASTANIIHHAEIIIENHTLRQLAEVCDETARRCYEPLTKSIDALDIHEARITSIIQSHEVGRAYKLSELLPEANIRISEIADGKYTGFKTGFADIDKLIGFMSPGDFVIVAGLESSGKTSLALRIAEDLSLVQDISVGIFPIEGTREKIAMRLLCSRAHVSQLDIKNQKINEKDYQRLAVASGELEPAQIYVDDTSGVTPLDIRAKMRSMQRKYGCQFFIVDYLQEINVPGITDDMVRVSTAARYFRDVAKELRSVVMLISSVPYSEDAVKKGGAALTAKYSKDVNYAADIFMGVWRQNREDRVAKIFINKARDASPGIVNLAFLPEYTRFENYAKG